MYIYKACLVFFKEDSSEKPTEAGSDSGPKILATTSLSETPQRGNTGTLTWALETLKIT